MPHYDLLCTLEALALAVGALQDGLGSLSFLVEVLPVTWRRRFCM